MSLPRAPYPENGIAYAHQSDTVDLICQRYFSRTKDLAEQTLDLNEGLAALGPVLPHGTRVILPAPAAIRLSPVRRTINLWD